MSLARGGGPSRTTGRVGFLLIAMLLFVSCGSVANTANSSHPTSRGTPTSTGSHPPLTTTTSSSGPVTLPVVECPTSRGVGGTPPAAYPSTIAASLNPTMAEEVSYYSDDTRSLLPIMGPRGWDCSVGVGADGSTVVAVFPASESSAFSGNPLYPQPFTPSPNQAVVAYSPAACQGCIYDLVCPLIAYAGQQLGQVGQPCPGAKPSDESVDWLNGSPSGTVGTGASDEVAFEDPPGVAGDGSPSGGPYPSNGVINYTYGPLSEGMASSMTCTLPASGHSVCTAILNDFTTRGWPGSG